MNIRTDNQNHELHKGESQRNDGTYMYRYTDSSGARKCIYASDLEILRQKETALNMNVTTNSANTNIANINSANTNTAKADTDEMTLNEHFRRYMALKTHITQTTRDNQNCLWNNHVKDSLGKKCLGDIRKSDILQLYCILSEQSGLCNSTIHHIHHLLHPCFELAVDDDLIRKNPCRGCLKGYPNDTKEKQALSATEQQKFLNYIHTSGLFSRYYPMFAFMLETGLRRGEVLGLTWADVNLKKKSIYIDHQLQYGKQNEKMRFYAASPKTDAGIRTIPLTSFAVEMLTLQKNFQEAEHRQSETAIDGYTNFIFTTRKCTPYVPSNINVILAEIADSYNVETGKSLPHITAHILRHTACTRMAEAGMDPKVLQYIMGHSSISVTMKVYNHVSEDRNRREMKRMEKKRRDITGQVE